VLHVGRESLTARGYAKTCSGVPVNCKPIDGDKNAHFITTLVAVIMTCTSRWQHL
jgi:hypothetical protein